jgi:hypothetical protein
MDRGAHAPSRAVSSALAGNIERVRTSHTSKSATRASLTAPEAGALPNLFCKGAQMPHEFNAIAPNKKPLQIPGAALL